MSTANAIRASEQAAREAHPAPAVNVGHAERVASQVGGGVLIGVGLLRRGLPGLALAGLGAALLYRGTTGHCSLYSALGASTVDDDPGPEDSVPAQAGVHVVEAITILKPADELWRFWRDYANLPKFQSEIESVTQTGGHDDKHSHWVMKGPFGTKVEWDAEIIEERPGELIAWRSLGGDVETAGSVRFVPAPGDRGTEVRVNQKFNPPGGKLGIALAKLFRQDPETHTRESLRNLRMLMEAGEIATISGQPSGRA